MSLNNENNPNVSIIPLGSLAVDGSVPGLYAKKKMRVLSVELLNGAAIAASDTDYIALSLKKVDDTIVAELDTRAAHEGAVVAFTGKPLNLITAEIDVAAGSSLKAVYDETDTGTAVALTDAVLAVTWCGY